MKGEIDNSMIIAGDFNTLSSVIFHKTTRQKINKEAEDLNNTVNKQDLTDIHRTLQQQQHSSQERMECSPGQIIYQAVKQISVNLKGQK